MYRAIGTYQIDEYLTLTDFTFIVTSAHQDLTKSKTEIGVLYNNTHARVRVVDGILSAAEAIAEVKTWYSHEVITEQTSESVEVTQTTLRDKVLARQDLGAKILLDFDEYRIANPTNIQEDLALAQVLGPMEMPLRRGYLGMAVPLLQTIIANITSYPSLSATFVQEKLSEIQTYLANESN